MTVAPKARTRARKKEKNDVAAAPKTKKHKNKSPKQIRMSQTLLVNRFRVNGAAALSKEEKATLILAAKDAYYNVGEAILTDAEYDILEDAAKTEGVAVKIGAEVTGGVQLPYLAPSLDKIKTEKDLTKWLGRYKGNKRGTNKAFISCKLDGCSLLVWCDSAGQIRLYTRGDGIKGTDVTRILPHLRHLGTGLLPNTCIRGELIMTKALFAAKYAAKYANIRNMIAGALARKTSMDSALIGDLNFVAYEVIAQSGAPMPAAGQFSYLLGNHWKTVWHKEVPLSAISVESLSEELLDKRENYEYEIDGIVCVADGVFVRPTKEDENPDYAFAFKMELSDQKAEVLVTGVTWAVSKDGYLKPSVNYEPVELSGVICRNATGINAAFIKKGRIGVGALLEIIRSGDVIPKILRVITPAVVTAMPTVSAHWTYNNKGDEVDLVVDTLEENEEVIATNMLYFFTKLDVDGIKEGVVAKLIAAGFNTVTAVLAMTKADWLTLEGVKDASATKLLAAVVKKVGAASLLSVMSASNLFGRGMGERKMAPIMAAYPQALFVPPSIEQLLAIDGVGPETAKAFLAGIAPFIAFANESPILLAKVAVPASASASASVSAMGPKKSIVMSGFRDKEFAAWCATNGIDVADSVSKTTTALIVKDKGEVTGKVEKAKKYGVAVMTMAEFMAMSK